jgi:hypothetical protein
MTTPWVPPRSGPTRAPPTPNPTDRRLTTAPSPPQNTSRQQLAGSAIGSPINTNTVGISTPQPITKPQTNEIKSADFSPKQPPNGLDIATNSVSATLSSSPNPLPTSFQNSSTVPTTYPNNSYQSSTLRLSSHNSSHNPVDLSATTPNPSITSSTEQPPSSSGNASTVKYCPVQREWLVDEDNNDNDQTNDEPDPWDVITPISRRNAQFLTNPACTTTKPIQITPTQPTKQNNPSQTNTIASDIPSTQPVSIPSSGPSALKNSHTFFTTHSTFSTHKPSGFSPAPNLSHSRSYAKLDLPVATASSIPQSSPNAQALRPSNPHAPQSYPTETASVIDNNKRLSMEGDFDDETEPSEGELQLRRFPSFARIGSTESVQTGHSSAGSRTSYQEYENNRASQGKLTTFGVIIPDLAKLGEDWWVPQVELIEAQQNQVCLTTKGFQNLQNYDGSQSLQPSLHGPVVYLPTLGNANIGPQKSPKQGLCPLTVTSVVQNSQSNQENDKSLDSLHITPPPIPSPPFEDTSILAQPKPSSQSSSQSSSSSLSSPLATPGPSWLLSRPFSTTLTSIDPYPQNRPSNPSNSLSPPPLPPIPPLPMEDEFNPLDPEYLAPKTSIIGDDQTNTKLTPKKSLNITLSNTTSKPSQSSPRSSVIPLSPKSQQALRATFSSKFFPTAVTPQLPHLDDNTPFVDGVISELSSLPPVEVTLEPIKQALSTQTSLGTVPTSLLHKQASITDELIGMDKAISLWEFEDIRVRKRYDFFRASTLLHSSSDRPFTQWHFPEYFSKQPLLSGIVKKNISIQLPPDVFASLQGQHRPQRKMFRVGMEDLVGPYITNSIDALYGKNSGVDANEFVFKVLGQNEYLSHDKLFWSYNYIRHCVRNNQEVELVLIQRPQPLDITSEQQSIQSNMTAEYYSQLQAQTVVNIHALFSSLPNPPVDLGPSAPYHQQLSTPFIPLLNVDTPFTLQLCGIEALNSNTLPRMNPEITSIYLRIVLFHGVQPLPYDVHVPIHIAGTEYSMTNHIEQPSLLMDPIILNRHIYGNNTQTNGGTSITENPVLISALPREARIGFVLYGRTSKPKTDKKNATLSKDWLSKQNSGGKMSISIENNEPDQSKIIPLGFVVNQLIDEYGHLITGRVTHRLWPFPADEGGKKVGGKRDKDPLFLFRANNHDNHLITTGDKPICLIHVKYPSFSLPVFSPLISPYVKPNLTALSIETPDQVKISRVLSFIKKLTPLALSRSRLTPTQAAEIFACRLSLVQDFAALPIFLLSVDWGCVHQRNEAYRLLPIWTKPNTPLNFISLLDVCYPDYRVRSFAVSQLKQLSDEELRLYLLQMVQCIKYEANHYSPLVQFLVERAVESPYEIGYPLYWSFKSEVHDPIVMERFTLLLQHLIVHIGPILVDNLQKQYHSVRELQAVADYVLHLKRNLGYSNAEAMKLYREKLEHLNKTLFSQQGKFPVPLKPVLEATELIVDKCRFMSSKMVPLWLVFKNADPMGPPIYIIFKSGDDLRQDLLTLQILRIMDRLWLNNGLDCRLKPYEVIATGVNDHGEGVGMIEVVLNSTTTADIQDEYGGGTLGALKLRTIDTFLRQHNPPDSPLYQPAVHNFLLSLAGYCIATYILGIGDRHNGNIMVTKGGHLFHIDFGHFLGNFKTKFGINRERAAFVFTPEMAYVVGQYIPPGVQSISGGPGSPQHQVGGNGGVNQPLEEYKTSSGFQHFKSIASQAFIMCRNEAWLLETLFLLLMPAGMPELVQDNDISYLEDKLQVHLDDQTAIRDLMGEFSKSLDSTSRRIDNLMHIWKHSKSK